MPSDARSDGSVQSPTRIIGRYALFAALALASAGTAQDLLGLPGVALVSLVAIGLGPQVLSVAGSLLRGRSARAITVAAIVVLVLATIAFAIVFPKVDVESGMVGSDRDEDADLAVRRLLALKYPYYTQTYLGNAITHMPGSLLLATPFVLLATSALQNLFWLPVFFIALRRTFSNPAAAFLGLVLLLVTPAVLREFLTGSDLITNNIYVVLPLLLVVRAPPRTTVRLLYAAGLGIALSSRSNFLFVVPLLATAIGREDGLREAARTVACSLGTFAAVTLPFFLFDPASFTPRSTLWRLAQFEDVLPYAAHVTVLLGVAVTLALCFTRMRRRGIELCRNAAIVQAVLVIVPVVLASLRAHRPDFAFLVSGYGLNVVFFALVGAWPVLEAAVRPARAPD